ncbi:hypothetical protein J3458_015586 [Metarhizium acridum]|uniref:uncharacterized protein n=1 Tax=Metarhizium acridum TaxID=92637 RepID=UPI001C6B8DBF|nr:hypothetical protein J3458_015586 [Metarhizium acridum]
MTSTQLPPLNFGAGGLRISLFSPTVPEPFVETEAPHPDQEMSEKLDELEQNATDLTQPPLTPHTIPIHPIPALQEAFSESLDEATNGVPGDKPKLRELDARGRREALIAQDRGDDPFDAKWRLRPGQNQHELIKLIAQISFGVYLLLNGMANSNAQVVSILQGHIDEVDEFLEVALEDLAQAIDDLNERIEHLKLPLANVRVFEQLLEDRNFRLEIIEGNEKIDHVLSRTNAALKQWDEDIEAGLQSTAAFTSWLNDEEDANWRMERPDVADIFDAMKGNTEGWLSAFDDMSDRVQEASNVIVRLSTIISEMEKKAGEVSRRTWANIQPFSVPSSSSQGLNDMSTKSVSSSRQSRNLPLRQHQHQSSVQSVATSTRSVSTIGLDLGEEFPLPGGLPLLPPQRSFLRHAPGNNFRTQTSIQPAPQSRAASKRADASSPIPSASEEPLYVLQPRTYTPQPQEPSPSPALKPAGTSSPKPQDPIQPQNNALGIDGQGTPQPRSSIVPQVFQKANPPDALQIPPRPVRPPSPGLGTPRTTHSNALDSAYGSDSESITQRAASRAGSDVGRSSPARPHITHSPRSDNQQYYRPVRASPHSALQQRPHTSVGSRGSYLHLRSQPSAIGGMSTLSNVTNAVYDDDDRTQSSGSHTTGPRLRKKKSAFGWFKKAFSLDEEERAAFEARKAMQYRDRYHDPNSPKFIDGRRIR